jgi:aspartyl protease family protein
MPKSPDPTQKFGTFMVIGAWVLVLLFFAFFFQQWSKKENAAKAPVIMNEQGVVETVLRRNADHQYVTQGEINQVPVVFLLDTGATEVVIPNNIAEKLHLPKGPQAMAVTAGGNVEVTSTRIKELKIGHIVLHDLFATINPHMEGEEILLGMNALKKINFRQQGEDLILSSSP